MTKKNKRCKLVLGTAQLGLAYGVANRTGMPEETDAIALVHAAIAGGITTIDTARAYGHAEYRVGLALNGTSNVTVVTKLDPLAQISPGASPDAAIAATRNSLELSRAALGRDHLDVLLLHRAEHRTRWNGAVWRLLVEEQARGTIGKLGLSAQSPADVIDALSDPQMRYLQLPFNLLDWRWEEAGAIEHLRRRSDVNVDVRSAFLQGLLVNDTTRWPIVEDEEGTQITDMLTKFVHEAGRDSRADLCLAFVRAQDWIDGVVVGCETLEQLQDNLALFRAAPLEWQAVDRIVRDRPRVSADLLDPSRWSR